MSSMFFFTERSLCPEEKKSNYAIECCCFQCMICILNRLALTGEMLSQVNSRKDPNLNCTLNVLSGLRNLGYIVKERAEVCIFQFIHKQSYIYFMNVISIHLTSGMY